MSEPGTPPLPPGQVEFQRFGQGQIAVRTPEGDIAGIREEDASDALAQGMRPATDAEVQGYRAGTLGKVASAAIGVGRGAGEVVGLPVDMLAIEGSRLIAGDASAEDTRRALRLAKEANPTETLGGELLGGALGMYLMPGGGGATSGTSLAARAASRFVASAPRAALETAAMSLAAQANEDAIQNHEAVAEKYLTAGLGGLVFGGLMGGGLHALGGAGYDAAKKYIGRAGEMFAKEAEGEAAKGSKSLLQRIAGTAEEQAFKSTGAKLRDIQLLGKTAEAQEGRMQAIGRRLLDEGIVDATASQETIAKRLTAKVREAGQELSKLRNKLDSAATRMSTEDVGRRVMDEVLVPLEAMPGAEVESKAVRDYMISFLDKLGERPDFKKVYEARLALDKKLSPKLWMKTGQPTPGAEALGQVRNIIEDEFTKAGESAAKELGGSFAEKYGVAKALYADLITAEKIAGKEAARNAANRAISLTDTIAGGAGLAGGLAGSDNDASGAVLGAAAMLGNRVMRTRGNQIAAHVLDKATKMGMVQRAVTSMDEAVSKSVRAFLTGEKVPTKELRQSTRKLTADDVAAVRKAVSDPQALVANVAKRMEETGIAAASPKVAQAATTALLRTASHLQKTLSKPPPQAGISFLPQPPRRGSESQLARDIEIIEGADDPGAVLDDFQHGRLSREKVAALRVANPQLYEQIKAEIRKQGPALARELSVQDEVALSLLFGQPISAMMDPRYVSEFQKTFAQGADPSQAGQASEQQPAQMGRGLRRLPSLASGFDKQEAPT